MERSLERVRDHLRRTHQPEQQLISCFRTESEQSQACYAVAVEFAHCQTMSVDGETFTEVREVLQVV